MINKIKNFLLDVFGFTSMIFTFYVIVEIIFQIANKSDMIQISSLVVSLIICILIAIVNYAIWYTDLFKKCNYLAKNLLQYFCGLILIYLCNDIDITDIQRIIFQFIYYNILYFGIYFIVIFRERKNVEKLNKIIMKLKEDEDEQN